ncbi:MAG: type II toxin-antitoxin system RelE/ParE family toxin [bacterium]|nr:type II toxin-antitoxin system RelE/ParE family toxin [bacterium]MDZ4299893.1 type II toxin-antitoxin system RelE/ParE family toxin [Candidatus Sungbacteria bacterium]
MKVFRTVDFDRAYRNLPKEIQKLCDVQLERFEESPRDPRLHGKKLHDTGGVFSLRITRRYRAFFYLQNPEVVIFFDVDHRKDSYR